MVKILNIIGVGICSACLVVNIIQQNNFLTGVIVLGIVCNYIGATSE